MTKALPLLSIPKSRRGERWEALIVAWSISKTIILFITPAKDYYPGQHGLRGAANCLLL